MTTPIQTDNPFALDQTIPFLDATIVQSVTLPEMLRWEHDTGGFFVESEKAPSGLESPATFVTKEGKHVSGFAAKSFRFYPVAFRSWWESGDPGRQQRLASYQEGAHSRTQALGVLSDGTWMILTTHGLSSQSLATALRAHRLWSTRKLQTQPFAIPLLAEAGQVRKVGASYLTHFKFTTCENERCPQELGLKIRERWGEVQVWSEEAGNPGRSASQPASQDTQSTAEKSDQALRYADGSPANTANPAEVEAFQNYLAQKGGRPASRPALRTWVRNQRASTA
jgi:hypothetical protein